jgi:hypothetical protein
MGAHIASAAIITTNRVVNHDGGRVKYADKLLLDLIIGRHRLVRVGAIVNNDDLNQGKRIRLNRTHH